MQMPRFGRRPGRIARPQDALVGGDLDSTANPRGLPASDREDVLRYLLGEQKRGEPNDSEGVADPNAGDRVPENGGGLVDGADSADCGGGTDGTSGEI